MNWLNGLRILTQETTAKRRWFSSRLVCLSLCCQKFADCNSKSLPGGVILLWLRQRIKPLRQLPADTCRECRLMQPFDSPFQRKEHFYSECFILCPLLQSARSGAPRPQRVGSGDTSFKEQDFKLKGQVRQILKTGSLMTLVALFPCRTECKRGELKQPLPVLP